MQGFSKAFRARAGVMTPGGGGGVVVCSRRSSGPAFEWADFLVAQRDRVRTLREPGRADVEAVGAGRCNAVARATHRALQGHRTPCPMNPVHQFPASALHRSAAPGAFR